MTDQTSFAVMAMWIDPTKDEPGISLPTVEVEAEGLAGDNSQIEITGTPSNCPGVYASVVRPGAVTIGDRLEPSAR